MVILYLIAYGLAGMLLVLILALFGIINEGDIITPIVLLWPLALFVAVISGFDILVKRIIFKAKGGVLGRKSNGGFKF